MSEWLCTTMKEIAKVKGGKRLPAGSEFAEGFTPFPYLRVTNMVNSTIKNEIVYVKPEIEPIIRNYKISKNDIYVTIAGTLGNFGNIPNSYDSAQLTENAAKITDINDAEYDKKYLVYSFNSDYVQKQIRKEIGIGGGVPKLALHRIERLKVKYPPLPHQRKIARILTTVDNIIEKTESAIEKYKAIKQGMMHDLFTRGIDVKTGKLRPTYEDAPDLYKETELGMIPKEWEFVNISDKSSFVTNGFVGVATPFYTNKDNGVRYLYGTNIRANEVDLRDIRYVTKEFHIKQLKSNLQPGDMLTVQSGHIGTSAIVPEDFGEANCHALIITRFNSADINPDYICYYLNSEVGMSQMEKLFIGSTIKHINTSDLAKHLVIMPNNDEQDIAVDKINAIQKLLLNEKNFSLKTMELKQALMQDLLTGKKDVTPDPEDYDNEQ